MSAFSFPLLVFLTCPLAPQVIRYIPIILDHKRLSQQKVMQLLCLSSITQPSFKLESEVTGYL